MKTDRSEQRNKLAAALAKAGEDIKSIEKDEENRRYNKIQAHWRNRLSRAKFHVGVWIIQLVERVILTDKEIK